MGLVFTLSELESEPEAVTKYYSSHDASGWHQFIAIWLGIIELAFIIKKARVIPDPGTSFFNPYFTVTGMNRKLAYCQIFPPLTGIIQPASLCVPRNRLPL